MFIEGETMRVRCDLSDKYVPITKALFKKYLEDEDGENAFIPQEKMERMFHVAVQQCTKNTGELFAHHIKIVTEKLSPLAMDAITTIAQKHGYDVECENRLTQMEYLGSDGGGHYSQDFYRYLEYGLIDVTAR